jgi:3-oxoadipate enol-lactonase
LIIVGEEDPSTPVASAQALNKAIKGSTLKIIPQAAHISPIEQAEAVTHAIGDFLAAQKG